MHLGFVGRVLLMEFSPGKRSVLLALASAVTFYLVLVVAVCLMGGYTFWGEGELLYVLFFVGRFAKFAAFMILAGAVFAAVVFGGLRDRWGLGTFVMTATVAHFLFIQVLHRWPQSRAMPAAVVAAGAHWRVRSLDLQEHGSAPVPELFRQHLGRATYSSHDGAILHYIIHGLLFTIVLDTAVQPPAVTVRFRRS